MLIFVNRKCKLILGPNLKGIFVVPLLLAGSHLLAVVPRYRVVPLEPDSRDATTGNRSYGYEGLDDAGNAYVNVIDYQHPERSYEERWDGTSLAGYLPDETFGVKSISSAGDVVLQNFSGSQPPIQSAVWTVSQGLRKLPTPAMLPGWGLYAQNANSAGVVAGAAWDGNNNTIPHVVIWDANGAPHDLGVPLTGNTNPHISDEGVLYGETQRLPANNYANQTSVGFVGLDEQMQLISIPGSDAVFVTDMNATGTALVRGLSGYDVQDAQIRGFVWANGTLTALPLVSGNAGNATGEAINDDKYIVGNQGQAALWEPDLSPHFLDDLLSPQDSTAWFVAAAYDINNSGVILAEVGRRTFTADGHVYLNEPALLIPISIPEPALLGFGLIPLTLLTRRRS